MKSLLSADRPAYLSRRLSLTLLALLLALTSLSASAAKTDLQLPMTTGLQQIGRGTLRWLGFHVYDASTWATQKPLPTDGSVPAPFALQIIYARDISARDLVSATESAWAELDLLDRQAKNWLPALEQLWPDIKAGDCLVLYIDGETAAQFYHNGRAIGRIDDQQFARRFVAIWLDPNTSEPALRQQLLGASS